MPAFRLSAKSLEDLKSIGLFTLKLSASCTIVWTWRLAWAVVNQSKIEFILINFGPSGLVEKRKFRDVKSEVS